MSNITKSIPELIIRPQTAIEELEYLWVVLSDIPLFRKHNYKYIIPDHPEFKRLERISPNFDEVDRKATSRLFIKELYDPNFYKPGIKALKEVRPLLNGALLKMMQFNLEWGFRILPINQVLLTRYGPGGDMDIKSGVIIVMVKANGTFKRNYPSHTPIHELVEIGIHHLIKLYRLTHAEKERIVDHICVSGLGKFVPGYVFQTANSNLTSIGDKRVDPYFENGIDNLPEILKRYVAEYPR